MSVTEAAAALGISAWSAYRLIQSDDFPVPVIRLGRVIRVPRRPLEQLLGLAW